jgi:hypothetical protein
MQKLFQRSKCALQQVPKRKFSTEGDFVLQTLILFLQNHLLLGKRMELLSYIPCGHSNSSTNGEFNKG